MNDEGSRFLKSVAHNILNNPGQKRAAAVRGAQAVEAIAREADQGEQYFLNASSSAFLLKF